MGWTKGNRWTREAKKRSTEKHLKQKERLRGWLLAKRLEANDYSYAVSSNTYSSVKCKMHTLDLTKELPGRDALKEVYTFLMSHTFPQNYKLALTSALHKVKGRRFVDESGRKGIIRNLKDVTQVIRESLRAAGIYNISVKDFVYRSLPK